MTYMECLGYTTDTLLGVFGAWPAWHDDPIGRGEEIWSAIACCVKKTLLAIGPKMEVQNTEDSGDYKPPPVFAERHCLKSRVKTMGEMLHHREIW